MKQPGWSRRQIAELRASMEADYERKASEGDPPVVYFVQVDHGPESPVKIGVTTKRGLAHRLGGLQTSCPYRLKLLATMNGDYRDEERLHHSFRHARLMGEWFKPTPALLALVDGLRVGRLTSDLVSDSRGHAGDVSQEA
jgi:hypothetical protein